jgi:hypothetical protein
MPETKDNQSQQSQDVEEFLKKHPEYKGYIEQYDKDLKSTFETDDEALKGTTHEQQIKEKAELNYYTTLLNKKLQNKHPQEYNELINKYGDQKLGYKTRKTGADEFGKKNPNFYLTPDEQKQVFDENKADWDRYTELKQKYGKDLAGDKEDKNDPENWKYGARHAVVQFQSEYSDTIKNNKNNKLNNRASFNRTEKWNPEIEGTEGVTEFSNKNFSDPSLNTDPVYLRKLVKVSTEHDNRTSIPTKDGNITVEPGRHFYKHYDDGTVEEVNEATYATLQGFNKADIQTQNQPAFTEKVNINDLDEKNKAIVQQRLDALQQYNNNK